MNQNQTPVKWLADKLKTEFGYDLTVNEHSRQMLQEALDMETKSFAEFGTWMKSDPLHLSHDINEVAMYYTEIVNPNVNPPNTRKPVLGNVYMRPGRSKFVVTELNIVEIFSNLSEYHFVCDSAHDDGDYSYFCTFKWCRCHN